MTPPPAGPVATTVGVELLERAIAYTCGNLAQVRPDHLTRPTPCAGWNLADLLGHMEDSLDAFAEGADGAVGARSQAPTTLEHRLAAVRRKAVALLGAWTSYDAPVGAATTGAGAGGVRVGPHRIPAGLVAGLAAVEVAVHGWDVGRATRVGAAIPDTLATALEPWARHLAIDDAAARPPGGGRFAAPVVGAAGAAPAVRLLGLLGRRD